MNDQAVRRKALDLIQKHGADALTWARQERERDIALGGLDRAAGWDRVYVEIARILREAGLFPPNCDETTAASLH